MGNIRGVRRATVFFVMVFLTTTLNILSAQQAGTQQKTVLQECFDIVVDKMSADWKQLGYSLGLSHNHIEGIGKVSLLEPETSCRAVLEKWREIRGKQATKGNLITAIKSIQRKDVVEALEGIGSEFSDELTIPMPSMAMAVVTVGVAIVVIAIITVTTRSRKNRAREVFICHTSEDKERFVRPLVTGLIEQGIPESAIFYDELSLRTGDRLRVKIPFTLRSPSMKLFVFVISNRVLDNPHKIWPKYELSFANALEKRIFPIWLGENGVNWGEFGEKVQDLSKLADITDILATRVKVEEVNDKLPDIVKDIKSQLDSLRENKKDL